MSLPAVSKHLRVLENAGLVRRRRTGRVHSLKLEVEPMKQAKRLGSRNIASSGKAASTASMNICNNSKNRKKMTNNHPSELRVVLTRVLNAPCPLVFQAWTEPARLAAMVQPEGSSNATR